MKYLYVAYLFIFLSMASFPVQQAFAQSSHRTASCPQPGAPEISVSVGQGRTRHFSSRNSAQITQEKKRRYRNTSGQIQGSMSQADIVADVEIEHQLFTPQGCAAITRINIHAVLR